MARIISSYVKRSTAANNRERAKVGATHSIASGRHPIGDRVQALATAVVKESEPNRGRQNHAVWRKCDEVAHGFLVNSASSSTENSPLRTATLTWARQ